MPARSSGDCWIPADKAELLFGRIGETAKLGGAKVVLHKGPPGTFWKLTLHGTESEMGRAASQVIVNLWADANEPDAVQKPVWCYDPTDAEDTSPYINCERQRATNNASLASKVKDCKRSLATKCKDGQGFGGLTKANKQMGPFPWSKIEAWVKAGKFRHPDTKQLMYGLSMEHDEAKCRMELWLALAMHNVVIPDKTDAVDMEEDAPPEEAAELLRAAREQLQVCRWKTSDALNAWANLESVLLGEQCDSVDMEVEDAELAVLVPVPMDIVFDTAPHLFVVVDTNVLLTHGTLLERMFTVLHSDDMRRHLAANGVPAFNIVVVVPYMVMVELDYIKDRKGAGAELSPFAAKAIRTLDEERKKHPFRYVGESFSDFKQSKVEFGDSDLKPRNDDRIIYCAKALARRVEKEGSAHDTVVLLSRDTNLRLKAIQHDVRALDMKELPSTSVDLLGLCIQGVMAPSPPPASDAPPLAGTRPPVKTATRGRGGYSSPDYQGGSPSTGGQPVVESPFVRMTSSPLGRAHSPNYGLPRRFTGEPRSRAGSGLSGHTSSGLQGDIEDPELEHFVDELTRIVEEPLAIAFLYCLQCSMQDLWENVVAEKPPWTASQLLDSMDRNLSILTDNGCINESRAIQEAVKGKNTPLRELLRSKGRNPRRLEALLPPAADALAALMAQFTAPRGTTETPKDNVPGRVNTPEYLEAINRGCMDASDLAAAIRGRGQRQGSAVFPPDIALQHLALDGKGSRGMAGAGPQAAYPGGRLSGLSSQGSGPSGAPLASFGATLERFHMMPSPPPIHPSQLHISASLGSGPSGMGPGRSSSLGTPVINMSSGMGSQMVPSGMGLPPSLGQNTGPSTGGMGPNMGPGMGLTSNFSMQSGMASGMGLGTTPGMGGVLHMEHAMLAAGHGMDGMGHLLGHYGTGAYGGGPTGMMADARGQGMAPGSEIAEGAVNGPRTDGMSRTRTVSLQGKLSELQGYLHVSYTSAVKNTEEGSQEARNLILACRDSIPKLRQIHAAYQKAVQEADSKHVRLALETLDRVLSATIAALGGEAVQARPPGQSELAEQHAYLDFKQEELASMIALMEQICQHVDPTADLRVAV